MRVRLYKYNGEKFEPTGEYGHMSLAQFEMLRRTSRVVVPTECDGFSISMTTYRSVYRMIEGVRTVVGAYVE